MADLNANVYAAHTPITLGRLRNGPAVNVTRTARESSIASKYYFSGVRYAQRLRGDPATFRTACPVVVLFEAQWRNAFHTIVEASVADANAAHGAAAVAGAAGFDENAARATAATSVTNRLEAIAIGAVHTSLVLSYEIGPNDLRATEVGPSVLSVVAGPPSANRDDYNALARTTSAGWRVILTSGHAVGNETDAEQVALTAAALSNDEAELAYTLMSMGQAAPVRAGAQLYDDGHHYHSDGDQSTRHKAIEREVTGTMAAPAKNIWRAHVMMFRNAVWHAAIHAVLTDVLQGFAEDNDIVDRLDATGFGSMSVGLPAQEDLFRRAGSYIACYTQVIQTATAHGHTISIDNLRAAVNALSGLPRTGALPRMRPDLPGNPSAAWPPGCTTRAKALKIFLEPILDIAEPVAAWMFGFFREICSRNGIRANSQEGSLLRSYSLKRAVANFIGEANRASEMYAARARYIRAEGEKGNLETYAGTA